MEDDFLNAGFLSPEEAAEMFGDSTQEEVNEPETEPETSNETQETNIETTTEETSEPEHEPESSESVSSEETQGQKNTTPPEEEGSPNTSSIAQALQELGVLRTLDNDRISKIADDDDLNDALEEEVHNRLDDHIKRVDEALKWRMPVSEIQMYENNLKTLNAITNEMLDDEKNENYRKNLIYQDLINKGYEKDEALETLEEYLDSGKEVDKSKKALTSLKNYYTKHYDAAKQAAKEKFEKEQADIKKQAKELKESILEDTGIFQDLDISTTDRRKIHELVSKPVETDDDGKQYSALQKYAKENPITFNKMVGMFYVLTDGFTKVEGLIKGPVKKERRKGVETLERVLNNTPRTKGGALNLKSGVSSEASSMIDINKFEFDV